MITKISETQGKSNTTNSPRQYHGCRINQNGQYGKCYFKMYSQSWTGHLEVNEHTCVEATKQEAT
uniref:Uncharacterized protein n=1 Tax=Romanomermis culicivorax TaxID=13658 RepID=A0A915HTJ5_ROMCU